MAVIITYYGCLHYNCIGCKSTNIICPASSHSYRLLLVHFMTLSTNMQCCILLAYSSPLFTIISIQSHKFKTCYHVACENACSRSSPSHMITVSDQVCVFLFIMPCSQTIHVFIFQYEKVRHPWHG